MGIVVTGIGAVSACGIGADALWDGVAGGQSLARPVERLARDGEPAPEAFEVQGFDPGAILGAKGLRLLDRSTLLTLVATRLALQDAGLLDLMPGWESTRPPGLVVGTSFGSIASIASYIGERIAKGPAALNPSLFPNTVINSPASQAAIRFGFTTLCTTLTTGWASGAAAIGYAADALRRGRVDIVLAGGVDELTADSLAVYRDMGLAPGFGMGEGACLLVLERESEALRRGARPLARLAGRGSGFGKAGDMRGLGRAVAEAFAMAAMPQAASNVPASSPLAPRVDLLVSGACGLAEFDAAEAAVLAGACRSACILKPKVVLGEADGAGGALGAAIAAMAIARRQAPGYDSEVRSALVSAPSYTGHAAALVFERFDA